MENIEFDRIISAFSFSNYGLIAVQSFNSIYGSYSLFQFEGSAVISVLKNSIEYSFVFFKCLLKRIDCAKRGVGVFWNILPWSFAVLTLLSCSV